MNPFKVGDVVKCVKPESQNGIVLNEQYEIRRIDGKLIWFHNIEPGYFHWRFELANDKIQVGDMVECVDCGSGAFLTLGKTYEVLAIVRDSVKIVYDSGGIDLFFIARFKKIKQNKTMNKEINYCVRIMKAGEFATSGQFRSTDICEASIVYKDCVKSAPHETYALFMNSDGVDTMIEKTVPEIVIPKVNGYEMKYEKNAAYVQFGCAEISLHQLALIKKAMVTDYHVNRTISEIILSSGVHITKAKIEEIFAYVKKVNGKAYPAS